MLKPFFLSLNQRTAKEMTRSEPVPNFGSAGLLLTVQTLAGGHTSPFRCTARLVKRINFCFPGR